MDGPVEKRLATLTARPADRNTPTRTPEAKDTMKLHRTVVVEKPLNAVFDYLSDFTTTTEWDPGTVTTVRQHGNGGIGTTYLNTSQFLGRRTQLTYVVHELVDRQLIQLRGENKTVTAVDTLTFRGGITGSHHYQHWARKDELGDSACNHSTATGLATGS